MLRICIVVRDRDYTASYSAFYATVSVQSSVSAYSISNEVSDEKIRKRQVIRGENSFFKGIKLRQETTLDVFSASQ